jgi:hypothetical protein
MLEYYLGEENQTYCINDPEFSKIKNSITKVNFDNNRLEGIVILNNECI